MAEREDIATKLPQESIASSNVQNFECSSTGKNLLGWGISSVLIYPDNILTTVLVSVCFHQEQFLQYSLIKPLHGTGLQDPAGEIAKQLKITEGFLVGDGRGRNRCHNIIKLL